MAGEHDPISRCERCRKPAYLMGKSGFHICLDRSPEVMQRNADLFEPKPQKKKYDPRASRGPLSDETRELIAEKSKARWDAYREANAERDKYVVEQYTTKDRTAKSIADELGVSAATIGNILTRFEEEGVVTKRPRGSNPEINKRNEAIVERYNNYEPVDKIAADYGVRPQAIRRILTDILGPLPVGVFAKEHEARNKEIIAKYKTGNHSMRNLAKEYGIADMTMRKLLADVEIDRMSPTEEAELNRTLVADYAKGDITFAKLAEKYNLGIRQVTAVLREAEEAGAVTIVPHRPDTSKLQRNADIRKKARQGTSSTKLAAEYGLTPSNIRKIIRSGNDNITKGALV